MLKRRVGEISLMNLDRIPHGPRRVRLDGHLEKNGDLMVYQLVMPEDADAEKG